MNTIIVKRPPRKTGPAQPEGRENMAATGASGAGWPRPQLAAHDPADGLRIAGLRTHARSPVTWIARHVPVVRHDGCGHDEHEPGHGGASGQRAASKMRAERRDYLRYLGQTRARGRGAADQQRAARLWNNPQPAAVVGRGVSSRLWERRPSHDDFGRVRIGLGRQQRPMLTLVPPQTKPVEDLEPLSRSRCDASPRRTGRCPACRSRWAAQLHQRRVRRATPVGRSDLVRAMLAQLATFHSPDELRIAVLADDAGRGDGTG